MRTEAIWHENIDYLKKNLSMNSVHPAVGAFLKNGSCSFTVWSPFKKNVEVVIEDGRITHELAKDERGYWSSSLPDVRAGAMYFFRLDKDKKFPDPASRAQLKGVHGPSSVVDTDYAWTDTEWKGIALADMVIYELHVGTFTGSHDFEGVIMKLPYLQRLGINAIEVMPVAQFPGSRNWGYDGVFPFAVQDSYGGVQGLKKLVDEAHRRGIAVILDVVYNHQGPEGNYLSEYGPYFTDKYKTGWGKAINFDDAWCDGVRQYYCQNALMWLDEFHIDALRMDAVHAIWDFSARHFIEELTARVRALEKQCGRKKLLIAEFDLNNPRYISPPAKGGYGMDGQWLDEFHHALHALVTEETDGYYEDFGKADHLAKSLRDSYVYTGDYSIHRKKTFGRMPHDATFDQFVTFAQNHDQIGNRMLGDRLTQHLSLEGLKLAAATFLLSPHVPMLFMGEEYGEKNPFQYFISHTDKKLIDLVRKGRKNEFSYFNWQGEVPDPQSEETFEQCVLTWDIDGRKEGPVLFRYYQHLIDFRKKRPAIKDKRRHTLKILSCGDGLVCFEKEAADDYLLIILNFNKLSVPFTLPKEENLHKVFDSSSDRWCGPGETIPLHTQANQSIVLNPLSVLIFEH
jgi:maltooligosyltrehalose trehalohydrolase